MGYKRRFQPSIWEVKDLWASNGRWKTGISNGKTIYEIMEFLGVPFHNTAEGREIRNICYQRVNRVSHSFLFDDGLVMGGHKVEKGMPKVYFIAKEVIEMAYLNDQLHQKTDRLNHRKAMHRLAMQTKLIKIKSTKKRLLLQNQIAKR